MKKKLQSKPMNPYIEFEPLEGYNEDAHLDKSAQKAISKNSKLTQAQKEQISRGPTSKQYRTKP